MVDIGNEAISSLDVFESLCHKIACLVYSRTEGNKILLNQILDDLNALDFNLFSLKNERGVLLINQCCNLIPPDEVSLSEKAVSLFTKIITKGQIAVEGKTLSLAVCWCSQCLKHGNQVNILKCLQVLVRGNSQKIEEENHLVLHEISKISSNFTFTFFGLEEISLNCLRYVEAITYPSVTTDQVLTKECVLQYFEIFKEILYRDKNCSVQNDIMFCKFLITAMRGIGNLIQMSDELINNQLGHILGFVKGYMLFGLLGQDNYKIQKIFPTSNTVPEVLKSLLPAKKLRGKYDRRSKKVPVTSITTVDEVDDIGASHNYLGFLEISQQPEASLAMSKTSDSEISDSEFSQNYKIKSYEGKVRHCALILLGTVVQKINPKLFIAYMPSFLPDGSEFQHVRTLITCLLKDPSLKCKSEVLGIISVIISNSRQYFLLADNVTKSSFTAFSYTISNIIKELHRALIYALQMDTNNTTIKRILKCMSDLIRCTPYHKVEPGLIMKIAKCVKPFLNHKDVNIQILALIIFGCLVSVEPKFQEVSDIIGNDTHHEEIIEHNITETDIDNLVIYEEDDIKTSERKPWLLEHCLRNLTNNGCYESVTNAALQVESLQVIGALARNFFTEIIINFTNDIIRLLQNFSKKSEYLLRLYSGKLMETILNSLQFSVYHEDESKRVSVSVAVYIWEALLPGAITELIRSYEEPMLRCTGCNCIANIGIQTQNVQTSSPSIFIFDQLQRDKQLMCLSLLNGCVRDESPAVRSSAARAMAIFILVPSLIEDSIFLIDAIETALRLYNDEQNLVRCQASWLYGNLSEAIVIKREKIDSDDTLTWKIIVELLKTGIKLASDKPKIKPGAVRGLGNLLQIVDENFIKKNKEIIVESLDVLLKIAHSETYVKARWNSCYAIANLLQNSLIHSNLEWMTKIFNVMTSLAQHSINFKVRINAALVLGVPPARENYGELYNNVWVAVLNALENSKNISDYSEYQHRGQLVNQLCIVMCHLISLISRRDINSLQETIYFHLDNLNHFMTTFHERVIPEKSNVLLSATRKIHSLLNKNGLTAEEKSLLMQLQNLLMNKR